MLVLRFVYLFILLFFLFFRFCTLRGGVAFDSIRRIYYNIIVMILLYYVQRWLLAIVPVAYAHGHNITPSRIIITYRVILTAR